ncbi:hypothetical protein B0H16DRAFT_1850514 [Mycena metata]|uniref:Uncharacterized protein n=1 Tax=Mycena metata TaxID=1033252 RepID=A0AAD7GIM4_9AGAR|nr:hypothetical protein B0H16DRAFT_1850514 [Mycena metata]
MPHMLSASTTSKNLLLIQDSYLTIISCTGFSKTYLYTTANELGKTHIKEQLTLTPGFPNFLISLECSLCSGLTRDQGGWQGRATSRMESTLVTLPTAGPSLGAAVEVGGSQNDLVHPYVSAAWTILSSVYQAVRQQREMDDKVVKLVKDIVELYSFKDDIHFVVAKIQILEDTLIKIAKHTLVCANFLAEYSQPKFSDVFRALTYNQSELFRQHL